MLLLLTLMQLRHHIAGRILQGLTGFTPSHISARCDKVEHVIYDTLQTLSYLSAPTLEQLRIAGNKFHDQWAFCRQRFKICMWNACTYHFVRPSKDDPSKECDYYYSRSLNAHAVKLSVFVAADGRKWIHEVFTTTRRCTDLSAGLASKVMKTVVSPSPELVVGGDISMAGSELYITPYPVDRVAKSMRNKSPKAQRRISENVKNFDDALERRRGVVGIVIGDLCKWAAVRGHPYATKNRDPEIAKRRMEICRGLQNYLYRVRDEG